MTCDLEHMLRCFYHELFLPERFVQTPFTKSYYALKFLYPNLWNEKILEIVSGLITGGILNYHLESLTKSQWNIKDKPQTQNIVLNLSHLGFGFQICFFLLYGSLLTFMLEFLVFWMVKKSKMFKAVKENCSTSGCTQKCFDPMIKRSVSQVFGDKVVGNEEIGKEKVKIDDIEQLMIILRDSS